MAKTTKKPGGWSAVRQQLTSWDKPALDELATLLRGEAREIYPQFSDRLARVEQMADNTGWGFCDYVADVVGQLELELGSR